MDNDLYQEFLLDNYKNPQNVGSISNPSATIREVNSSCGDEIEVDLKISQLENEYFVEEIKWRGNGCSISMASSSILSQVLVGKSIKEVLEIDVNKVQDLVGVKISVGRIKCLTLSIKAISKAINLFLKESLD